MSQEVDNILNRIQSHKGVVGTIIVNNGEISIKNTYASSKLEDKGNG